MKNLGVVLTCLMVIFSSHFSSAQGASENGFTPRLVVYGEASNKIQADVIVAYFNVYETNYELEYDPRRIQNLQQLKIDQLGLKRYMSNPTYEGLRSAPPGTPIEMKFTSPEVYTEMMMKASEASDDQVTVSLDFAYSQVSEMKKQTAKDLLINEAMKNAKEQADKLASAAAVRLGNIIYIEEMPDYNVYNYSDEGYTLGMGLYDVMVYVKLQIQYEILK